jgi:phage/plasmid-associated DNA primase
LEYRKAKNPDGSWKVGKEFEEMLQRVFAGDPDISQKIRSVRQMYGACLAPIKPRLFLLHGPQGSGKSSLIIPAMRLVHKDNWCSVQPHHFNKFNMAPMLGKIVNFCTDLSLTRAMEDSMVKTIEDRVPILIDRKNQDAVMAPLPAIHIFGGNGIPPTMDASSGAHRRRWTFIKLDAHKTVPGEYMHDFGNWVFDQDPYGVLAFALQGLEDLLQGGHYTIPDSGAEDMDEWGLENDPVGRFLDEVRRGNIENTNGRLIVDDALRIKPGDLWEFFKDFAQKTWTHQIRIGKFKFYARVQGAGFKRAKSGEIHFLGIGAIENYP